MATTSNYTEENIKSLDWREHIRLRPGMYIGKSGDGSSPDDGIYVLLKEVIDNCVDEFVMGEGKVIDITINDDFVSVRDFGRGIPRKNFKLIFNPGFTTKNKGWGLGLSLSKRIIEDYHKGILRIKKSIIGKGTNFEIIIKK